MPGMDGADRKSIISLILSAIDNVTLKPRKLHMCTHICSIGITEKGWSAGNFFPTNYFTNTIQSSNFLVI